MVKLKDIADVAGVTVATVSIALSGKGRVSDATRDRIVKIASDMDYKPFPRRNAALSEAIDMGLIIADNQHFILHDFLEFTESYQLKSRIEFIFNENSNADFPYLLDQARGILYIGFIGKKLRQFLNAHPEIPFVAIDEEAEYSVKTDYTDGVHRAIQYLLALGHKKIAFNGGCEVYVVPRIYNRAIEKCVQEYDIDGSEHFMPYHIEGKNSVEFMESSLKWARSVLYSKVRPTAFFCSGLITARAVIYVAMEAGLRIPEDLSVLALGTESDAVNAYPFVTTISENYPLLASTAMMMLQRRISGLRISEKNINIDSCFVVRGSTGPNGEKQK